MSMLSCVFKCEYIIHKYILCVLISLHVSVFCDEDTPLNVPKLCQPVGLGTRACCEDHA